MDQSARSAVLLLALLGALLFLQLAVAVEESGAKLYSYESSGDETEVAAEVEEAITGSVGRMLWQTSSSKSCTSAGKCHRWFHKPGCCNKKCVNLSNNKKHCGRCGQCCTKNTVCKDGKCRSVSKPRPQCGTHKPCKSGKVCCRGSCSDVKNDSRNCGKCSKKCSNGSFCCEGKCKISSNQDCGKWGKKCHFGSVCCKGECKFVHKSDRENCGACGKKCPHGVKCNFGMCGYGH